MIEWKKLETKKIDWNYYPINEWIKTDHHHQKKKTKPRPEPVARPPIIDHPWRFAWTKFINNFQSNHNPWYTHKHIEDNIFCFQKFFVNNEKNLLEKIKNYWIDQSNVFMIYSILILDRLVQKVIPFATIATFTCLQPKCFSQLASFNRPGSQSSWFLRKVFFLK